MARPSRCLTESGGRVSKTGSHSSDSTATNPLKSLLFPSRREFPPSDRGLRRFPCRKDASDPAHSLQTAPASPRRAGPVRFAWDEEQGIIREFRFLRAVSGTFRSELPRLFRGLRENSLIHRNRELNSAYQGIKFGGTGKELGRTGKFKKAPLGSRGPVSGPTHLARFRTVAPVRSKPSGCPRG